MPSSLALLWSLAAEPAIARRDGVELTWRAPADGCPSADDVLDDALAMLATPPPADTKVAAVAEVIADGDGFALTLDVDSGEGHGTRNVHASECVQLGRVAALVIALAIDPLAALPTEAPALEVPPPLDLPPQREPEPEPAASSVPEPVRVPVPARDLPPKPKPKRRRPLHASVVATAGLGAFALPGPTAALELALALAGPSWRTELGVTYWTPSTRSADANIGGRFQLAAGTARGCWVPHWRTIELPICALAIVGGMLGEGDGDLRKSSAAAVWAAFGGGPTLMWRPRWRDGLLALVLRVEGVGSPTQTTFQTTQMRQVWRSRAGALQAALGIEVRFAGRP